jgi:hypothetical protein
MKQIKNKIVNASFVDVVGTIALIGIITLVLVLFFFHSSNYIAHFSIASLGLLVPSNAIENKIKYPLLKMEKEDFIEQSFYNKLFKMNIKKCLKRNLSKDFILYNKQFIYKNN